MTTLLEGAIFVSVVLNLLFTAQLHRREQKYKKMREKFTTYLEELDKENEKLKEKLKEQKNLTKSRQI